MFYNCYFNKVHTIREIEDFYYYLIHPETFKKVLFVENISNLLGRSSIYPENTMTDDNGNIIT